jgi:hypothetical protein
MLDIYNHLAVFGLMFVSVFVINGFRFKDDLKNYPFEFFFATVIVSILIQCAVEITAFSIWYLSGGAS